MLYAGVDLGTSAVKLLLMDSEGKIRKIVSKEYPLYFPHPGWSEQKPEDWYEQTITGLKELLEGSDKSELAGISFGWLISRRVTKPLHMKRCTNGSINGYTVRCSWSCHLCIHQSLHYPHFRRRPRRWDRSFSIHFR